MDEDTYYEIEETITPGEWMVVEHDVNNPNVGNVVYDGTRADCEAWVRERDMY